MSSGPRRGGRPAPLVLLPAGIDDDAPFGSYRAVLATGRALLAAELSQRLGRLGAAVARLEASHPASPGAAFDWGAWFAAAAAAALDRATSQGRSVDAIGYAGAGALALVGDAALDVLLSPLPGEVVANNRFSVDAFVVAGESASAGLAGAAGATLRRAIERLGHCPADNTAARCLESVGFRARDLAEHPWSRFDVDTPLDLALLRLAASLPGTRKVDPSVSAFLAMAQLPGGRPLEVPWLAQIGAVMRDRAAQLVVAGRVPGEAVRLLETETACRVRWFIEERGMRSARDERPRSLLARWVETRSAAELIGELTGLGDAVILDTRVLMAALAGSSDASRWPGAEERFASDFGDHARVTTPWLRELTAAAGSAGVPVLMGGHALVSDGLRVLAATAWDGY
jgi:hypothetical protein